MDVETIELLEDKIPEDEILFRIGEYPSHIVIRSDFAEKLQKQFTGLNIANTGDDL